MSQLQCTYRTLAVLLSLELLGGGGLAAEVRIHLRERWTTLIFPELLVERVAPTHLGSGVQDDRTPVCSQRVVRADYVYVPPTKSVGEKA